MFLKKIILLYFFAHFLSGGMLEKELSKWDGYWRHFQYHVNRNPEYTFTRFVYVHFLDGKHDKWRKNRHRSVPFKKRDTTVAQTLIYNAVERVASKIFINTEEIRFVPVSIGNKLSKAFSVLIKPPAS